MVSTPPGTFGYVPPTNLSNERRPMPEAGFVVSGPVAQRHLPDKESTLDLHRHRHDGTQPTREKASPSHKADIEWTIKH